MVGTVGESYVSHNQRRAAKPSATYVCANNVGIVTVPPARPLPFMVR
jgi:hypothetical protein